MKAVSRFEANLLRVLRGIVQQTPIADLLEKPLARPRCLSGDAVLLIEDTLRKGIVQWLARQGWRRERFLRDGRPSDGRLWQRTPPTSLGLTFSPYALEFLLQFVSGTVGTTVARTDDTTLGDRLLFCLALDAVKAKPLVSTLEKNWTPLHEDGLCRLAFLDELPDGVPPFRIDWRSWTAAPGASILEALQGWLAHRWVELERHKENISTAARMRKLGATQERVLGEFFAALDQAARRDLARGFLVAVRRLLEDAPPARRWIARLDVTRERLADRQRLYQDALAFVRRLDHLRGWQQQALGIGYGDENYAASQLWKADWELFDGERLCQRAAAMRREIELV